MKKISLLVLLITAIVILSGCTINIAGSTSSQDGTIPTIDINWESIVALIVAGIAFISSILGTALMMNRDKKIPSLVLLHQIELYGQKKQRS